MSKIPKSESKQYKPESLMMSFGYRPELSEGSIKPPVFLTSTFVFQTAEEGKRFFEIAYGKEAMQPGEQLGLIYSRINNPDMEILEDRLAVWDGAESALVFSSGMAAISTVFLEFLKPGDVLLFSNPVYGGTHHFIRHVLPGLGIEAMEFCAGESAETILERAKTLGFSDRVKMVYAETPANPTNALVDLVEVAKVAKELGAVSCVDNTYLGPVFQRPLELGIDLLVYSATKYIGGHSDLIAGSVSGSADLVHRVRVLRTFLGNMNGPWTQWLMMRSLETLKIRMERQAETARKIADFLVRHPKVEKVYYLGHLEKGTPEHAIYQRQCLGAGAMLSFDVVRGEKAAFRFLNALRLISLAVSLGGTESLAEHPASMTHCDIPEEERDRIGITGKLVRISVGLEDPDDLIRDIEQALTEV